GGVLGSAGLGGGAVPGAASRYVHVAGPDQAGQPAQRAPTARGRAVGGDGRGAARLRVPVRAAGPAVEDGTAAPVPRHPAWFVHLVGAPRGAGHLRGGGGGA